MKENIIKIHTSNDYLIIYKHASVKVKLNNKNCTSNVFWYKRGNVLSPFCQGQQALHKLRFLLIILNFMCIASVFMFQINLSRRR